MEKPVVYYEYSGEIVVDNYAVVFHVKGHPRLGNPPVVYTTRVKKVFEDGFETRNTIYKRVKDAR